MIRDFKTSQLLGYKKELKDVLDGIDTALHARAALLEDFTSTAKAEAAIRDSLCDPEFYYYIKFLDKAITIVRLYNAREWFDDDDSRYHFSIRTYNFYPSDNYGLQYRKYSNHCDYGDFFDIADIWPYMRVYASQLICEVGKIVQSELMPVDIF